MLCSERRKRRYYSICFVYCLVYDYISTWNPSSHAVKLTETLTTEGTDYFKFSASLASLVRNTLILGVNAESSPSSSWKELAHDIHVHLSANSQTLGQFIAAVNLSTGFNLMIGRIEWKEMFETWTFVPQNIISDFDFL